MGVVSPLNDSMFEGVVRQRVSSSMRIGSFQYAYILCIDVGGRLLVLLQWCNVFLMFRASVASTRFVEHDVSRSAVRMLQMLRFGC